MKIRILILLAVGIITLSGCSRGADISENIPESTAGESEESQFSESTGTAEGSAFPDSPAGLTDSASASQTDFNGSVSLVRDKYDYLREMIDYSGQFVDFGELGFTSYVLTEEEIGGFGRLFSAKGEQLFFLSFASDEYGYPISDYIITGYNIITHETDFLVLSSDYRVDYIDEDYIIYSGSDGPVLLVRESGETMLMPESDKYSSNIYYGNDVRRVGQSFFYNITEEFSNADGSMTFTSSVLCRYAPRLDYFAKVAADMNIIGATDDDVYCVSSGSKIYRFRSDEAYASFEFPYDYLHISSGQAGYIAPMTSDTIFGRRYEVGRMLPDSTTHAYQYPILMTYFGTTASDIAVTNNSIAFVHLYSDTGIVLAVDINRGMAADTGYNMIRHSGSEWVYLSNYNDNSILAINTSSDQS